jgi:hypothetical protein
MPRTLEGLERRGIPGGTNCTLSFQSNDGSFSIAVRVRKLAHRWEAIFTESHAREHRAMYPRQRAVGQFALTLELKGYAEQEQVMNFFRSYVYSWQVGNKPTMHVVSQVKSFIRRGVPIKGMTIEDHVGSMVFMPTIIFESAQDPLDPTIILPSAASSHDLAGTETDVKNFFYPFSRASQDTNVRPETYYDFDDPTFAGTVNGALAGAARGVQNAVQDVLDNLGRRDGR